MPLCAAHVSLCHGPENVVADAVAEGHVIQFLSDRVQPAGVGIQCGVRIASRAPVLVEDVAVGRQRVDCCSKRLAPTGIVSESHIHVCMRRAAGSVGRAEMQHALASAEH